GGPSPSAVLAMQRAAGNGAVCGSLGADRWPLAADTAVLPAPSAILPSPSRSAVSGARTGEGGGSPWRKRYLANQGAVNAAGVQRFKNFSGWFSKKVDLESTAFNAGIGAALVITRPGGALDLSSADYRPSGTATAEGPVAEVGKHRLGWLQTVYTSQRSFYYSPQGHKRTWGAKILPPLLGKRRVVTDRLTKTPVRDGDDGVKPWYEINDCKDFGAASPSTKTTQMYDAPSSQQPFEITVDGTKQVLVKTRGKDSFRTWLTVRNEQDSRHAISRMNYVDWNVDYGTDITPDYKNPAASVVTPTTGGAKVTAVEQGTGLLWPELGDPTANSVAADKEGWW
ncbi:MAG: hypothetical protein ACRDY0_10590, partial [Acidimicrobiales bacterium]